MRLTAFDDTVLPEKDEKSRVLAWREHRLLALGYPLGGAAILACTPVDIHELERLIERGCPLELALRIAS